MHFVRYRRIIGRTRRLSAILAFVGVAGFVLSDTGSAQDIASAGARAPRFLIAQASPGARPIPLDVSRTAVLLRRIAVDFNGVPLKEALAVIADRAGLSLVYGDGVLPVGRRVALRAEEITVVAALTDVLVDLGVDVVFSRSGGATIVRRHPTVRGVLPGTLMGRVTDSMTEQGIVGVEVFLENTRWRVTSDTSGWYRLAEVEAGDYTLTVRRFGYAKQSRAVRVREGRTDTVHVAMASQATRLTDVITTATGRQRRLDIANDVTTINADSVLQAAPIRSVTDLLENRVPGLTVQRTSGSPGDPSRLRLRGVGTVLRNSDPIVIVDGIRVYAEQSAGRSGNLARPAGDTLSPGYKSATPSPLDYIDPNTIETIEVFKGPSAATLYGPDAANGVIVITTKKGQAGPTRWSMNVEHGRTDIVGEYPELVVRWGRDIYGENLVNCPVNNNAGGAARSVPCVGDSVTTFQILNDPALTMLDRGHRTKGSMTVSGGTQALTYNVTGSYTDEVGLIRLPAYEADRYRTLLEVAPPDWMRRPQHLTQWGVRSNVRMGLGANADLSFSSALTRTEQQKSALQEQLGTMMTRYFDRGSGTYYDLPGGVVNASFNPQGDENILNDYFERATAGAAQFTNGVNLKYRPRSWVTVTASVGLDVIQRVDQVFLPRGVGFRSSGALVSDSSQSGRVSDGQGRSVMTTMAFRANARRLLGRGFHLRFALGFDYTGRSVNDVGAGTRDLAPGSSLQGSTTTFLRRAETSDATFGWYVDPSIGNNKLNINTGLRLDRGSLYGGGLGGLKLPKFPKLQISYLISDEAWFPFKDLVQSFRVRVAYGRSNRQPGHEDKLRLYGTPAQVFTTGQLNTGIALTTLGNTEVGPERTAEFEGGFDADLFDGRLMLNVTGYRKTTDDALMPVPVAPEIYGGGVSIVRNIGTIRNTGLTLEVGGQVVRSGPVTWNTHVHFSQNRNVLVRLGEGVEPFYTNPEGNFTQSGLRVVAGYPVNGRWTRPIVGYADDNGNGALEPEEVLLGDTAVYVGATLPNYVAGVSTTLSLWRGAVVVNAHFSHNDGVAQRNTTAQDLARFSAGRQVPGTPLDEQAGTIDLVQTNLSGIVGGSDYNWVQTVSTTRFQSLSVRYTVPQTLARRLGAQRLSIAVQGGNLGLWTNYRGIDPNVNAFGTGNNVTDTGILPQPRTWQVQVNANY